MDFCFDIRFLNSHLFKAAKFSTFLFAHFWVLLSVWIWIPTLDGRPDVGGSSLFLAAVCLFIYPFKVPTPSKNFLRGVTMGILLATACLFRPQFLLGSTIFVATSVLFDLIRVAWLAKQENQAEHWIRQKFLGSLVGMFTFLFILFYSRLAIFSEI